MKIERFKRQVITPRMPGARTALSVRAKNQHYVRILRQSDGALAAWRRRFAGGADWSRTGLSRTSARGTDARVFDKLGRTLQEALARSEHQFHKLPRGPPPALQGFGRS